MPSLTSPQLNRFFSVLMGATILSSLMLNLSACSSVPDCQPASSATEVCDLIDNDCDGLIDEPDSTSLTVLYADQDGDGYGNPMQTCRGIKGNGFVSNNQDCDDTHADSNSGQHLEKCNDGSDNNCDGITLDCTIEGEIELDSAYTQYLSSEPISFVMAFPHLNADFSGDGIHDVFLQFSDSGESFIFPDLIPGTYQMTDALTLLEWGGGFGAVTASGDVNGDGVDDLLSLCSVETLGPGNDADVRGACLLLGPLLGHYTDYDATINILPTQYSTDLAGSLGMGDLNGDGLFDLIIGDSYDSDNPGSSIEFYLFYAPVSGTNRAENADATIASDPLSANLGSWISASGDLNGDGFDDVVVADAERSSGNCMSGEIYVFYGPLQGQLSISEADATLYSTRLSDLAGWSMSTEGDVNGDGNDDLLIGAPGEQEYCYGSEDTDDERGRAYLVYGPVYGRMSLDDADAIMEGEEPEDFAGRSVSIAGDLDGDGHHDVVIGAMGYDYDRNTLDAGAVYVIYAPQPGTHRLNEYPRLDLNSAKITTPVERQFLGAYVTAGDANDDGFDDLLLTVPGNEYDWGRSAVFLGGPHLAH